MEKIVRCMEKLLMTFELKNMGKKKQTRKIKYKGENDQKLFLIKIILYMANCL